MVTAVEAMMARDKDTRRKLTISLVLMCGLVGLSFAAGSTGGAARSTGLTDPAGITAGGEGCHANELPSQEGGRDPVPQIDVDLAAARCISDPYPSFNGVAVDPQNNLVALSDTNRKSILMYARSAGSKALGETTPIRRLMGPKTQIGFVAGVALDAQSRELFTINNDIEDTLMVFSYDAEGNVTPSRLLAVPHQSWGLALNRSREEIAVTVQSLDAVVFYRRDANRVDPPLRSIIGKNTGLADPHGLYVDEKNEEIVVASHGNWGEGDVSVGNLGAIEGGQFQPPSIAIFSEAAHGNAKPLRAIAGARTKLDWPMGVAADPLHDEIAVANNGDDSVLFFRRTDSGDVAPVRVIRGNRTGIVNPMGVAVDAKNNEIWVANFGGHSAVIFDLNTNGNTAPKRILRNAPAGTLTVGFGNPMAVAYDTKRGEILVPN
jgi:DNA-binding beta-propeller fold protein YncE